MKKALTIEELKNRVGKPVFVAGLIYGAKNWRVVKGFGGANTIEFTDKSAIAAEHQNKFRFFDTEVTALELREILDVEEKEKKKTGYEAVADGKSYFYISEELEMSEEYAYDHRNYIDTERLENGNYFNDENLTKNIARAERLKYQLRRYAALNGGITSQEDWNNLEIIKHYISYSSDTNYIESFETRRYKEFGQIYFKDIKACEKAIEIFKDELIWYFTELQEMLY